MSDMAAGKNMGILRMEWFALIIPHPEIGEAWFTGFPRMVVGISSMVSCSFPRFFPLDQSTDLKDCQGSVLKV
jgi:hypothetical protein